MAGVLYRKRGYAPALDLYEWYLKEAPDAIDVADVRQRVETCRKLLKATAN
jgi:hypothetical protein